MSPEGAAGGVPRLFSINALVRGLPPDEDRWCGAIAFHPEDDDPSRAEAIFFLWFDQPHPSHDAIIAALRQRIRSCLESLE